MLLTFTGQLYTLGIISPYITSYYQLDDESYANMIMPTIIILSCFTKPTGSYLVNKNINPKVLTALVTFVTMSLLLIASRTNSFITFFILYSFAQAFQLGFTYMIPVHHAWPWFPENRGLASGLAIGGFGFGPVLWNNIAT